MCLIINTCPVASVSGDDDVIECGLATVSNHANNAQEDNGSDIFVLGEYFRCLVDNVPMPVGHRVLLSHSCGKL